MEEAERAIVYLQNGIVQLIIVAVAVAEDESLYDKVLLNDRTTATFSKLSREGYPIYIQDNLRPTGIF
jgi:hypothetical protein